MRDTDPAERAVVLAASRSPVASLAEEAAAIIEALAVFPNRRYPKLSLEFVAAWNALMFYPAGSDEEMADAVLRWIDAAGECDRSEACSPDL